MGNQVGNQGQRPFSFNKIVADPIFPSKGIQKR